MAVSRKELLQEKLEKPR